MERKVIEKNVEDRLIDSVIEFAVKEELTIINVKEAMVKVYEHFEGNATLKERTALEIPVQEQSKCSYLGCDNNGTTLDDVEIETGVTEKKLVCKEHVGKLNQHIICDRHIIVGFDEAMLEAKLERINKLVNELQEEINSLPSTILCE